MKRIGPGPVLWISKRGTSLWDLILGDLPREVAVLEPPAALEAAAIGGESMAPALGLMGLIELLVSLLPKETRLLSTIGTTAIWLSITVCIFTAERIRLITCEQVILLQVTKDDSGSEIATCTNLSSPSGVDQTSQRLGCQLLCGSIPLLDRPGLLDV